MVFLKPKPK